MTKYIIPEDDIFISAFYEDNWEQFYRAYSENEHVYKYDIQKLREFIDNKRYLDVLKKYENTGAFPPPRLIMVNKKSSEKKRTVFSFDEDPSLVLKYYGFRLHCYDAYFCNNLYSFRKERSVKTAVSCLLKNKNINRYYGMKLDIHDYFNSADTCIALNKLKKWLKGQENLYRLIENILTDPYVYDNKSTNQDAEKIVSPEHKGLMAGSPLSPFLANIYLHELDEYFRDKEIFYARYSDDILFFARTKEEYDDAKAFVIQYLKENLLTVNPNKVKEIIPGEKFEFLGFGFDEGLVDISSQAFDKIKKKLKRKAKAICRWKEKRNVLPEKAVMVYIKYFNRKFFENPIKSELTWARWYFPVISTDRTLKEIDHYMQACIRFIFTGKHNKKNFNLRYDKIKSLGYRSLVNMYHKGFDIELQ